MIINISWLNRKKNSTTMTSEASGEWRCSGFARQQGSRPGGGHRHLVVEPEQANLWSPSLPQFENCSPSSLSDTPASSSSRYHGSLGEQSALRNPVSLTTDATSLRPTMIWRNPLYPTWDPYETGQSPSEDNVKRRRSTHPQCKWRRTKARVDPDLLNEQSN